MKSLDAWLRDDNNWWKCAGCEWCSECKRLAACDEHDDSDFVPRLIADLRASRAEVEEWQDKYDGAVEAVRANRLRYEAVEAEVERLRGELNVSELRARSAEHRETP